jgi:hypothetical protein
MTDYEAIAKRLDNQGPIPSVLLCREAAAALRKADQQQTRIERALVAGAADMRRARKQIIDMLVEIGNLREERDQLLAWKQSALELEKEWDCQRIGKLLHIPLGESVRAGIEPAIVTLLAMRAAEELHAPPPA